MSLVDHVETQQSAVWSTPTQHGHGMVRSQWLYKTRAQIGRYDTEEERHFVASAAPSLNDDQRRALENDRMVR